MDTTTHPNWAVLVIIAVLIIAAVAVGAYLWQRRMLRERAAMRERYGTEYERLVREHGQRKAEAELRSREKRVEALTIVPLSAADAARFTEAWRALQTRFVDNPKGVVIQADHLVSELMAKRGYPMADFEHRAGDISVHHPAVVSNYRAARAIAVRDERGQADTEELRRAVVHYRALFDELLEVEAPPAARAPAPRRVSMPS